MLLDPLPSHSAVSPAPTHQLMPRFLPWVNLYYVSSTSRPSFPGLTLHLLTDYILPQLACAWIPPTLGSVSVGHRSHLISLVFSTEPSIVWECWRHTSCQTASIHCSVILLFIIMYVSRYFPKYLLIFILRVWVFCLDVCLCTMPAYSVRRERYIPGTEATEGY